MVALAAASEAAPGAGGFARRRSGLLMFGLVAQPLGLVLAGHIAFGVMPIVRGSNSVCVTADEQLQLTTVNNNLFGGKNLKTRLFHPGQIAGR